MGKVEAKRGERCCDMQSTDAVYGVPVCAGVWWWADVVSSGVARQRWLYPDGGGDGDVRVPSDKLLVIQCCKDNFILKHIKYLEVCISTSFFL